MILDWGCQHPNPTHGEGYDYCEDCDAVRWLRRRVKHRRINPAEALERWLNSVYPEEEVNEATARIAQHDVNLEAWGKPPLRRRKKAGLE